MKGSRPQVFALHGGFVLTGVVTTLLGPLLPAIQARWAIGDAQAGRLFIAQFLGSLAGALVSGGVMSRLGAARGVFGGYLLIAAGVAGLAAGRFEAALMFTACFGLGLGLSIPATNLLVADLYPERRAAALNLLNLAWGAGAVAAPPLIAPVVRGAGLPALLLGIAVSAAVCAIVVLASGRQYTVKPAAKAGVRRITSVVWLTALLLFLYVGVENGIAGWMPSYGMRVHGLGAGVVAAVQAGFWGALLLGRLLAPVALRRLSPGAVILVGLGAAACGIAMVVSAASGTVLLAGALVAGGGLAAVFPTTVAVFTERLGEDAAALAGWVFAAAALGGAVLPWAIGYASAEWHSLRAALLIPLACTVAMLAVQLRLGIPQPRARRLRTATLPRPQPRV